MRHKNEKPTSPNANKFKTFSQALVSPGRSRMSTSVDVLHYGANERRAILLAKLGGKAVLREAIEKFYDRQVADPRLMIFFQGTQLDILKWHYLNLMSIAFTEVPKNFDIENLILTRHRRLFDDLGLSERNFDLVMEHFRDTLQEMGVDSDLINEALAVILPVRHVFVEGAEAARQRKREARWRRQSMAIGAAAGLCLFGLYTLTKAARRKK